VKLVTKGPFLINSLHSIRLNQLLYAVGLYCSENMVSQAMVDVSLLVR
jgi:hypothetical protein